MNTIQLTNEQLILLLDTIQGATDDLAGAIEFEENAEERHLLREEQTELLDLRRAILEPIPSPFGLTILGKPVL